MKTNKPSAALVWKQFEDLLVPRLRLTVTERAVYSHLFRHSHLEGKSQHRFSIKRLARAARLSDAPVRHAVRSLAAKGALRLVECTRAGHIVEVRLPHEIHPPRPDATVARDLASPPRPFTLEDADFLQTKSRREAIHARDRGLCFYCLRQLTGRVRCLDHVVPRARMGRNSYRNLVSCCVGCNTQKGQTVAEDFLRTLYRERRLTAAELAARLRALEALAAGDLRPILPTKKPQFGAGTPKPAPASYKRFPVWSLSFPRKRRTPPTT